jgi:hypothetical protein
MSNSTAAKVGTTSSRDSRRSKKSQEVTLKDTLTLDSPETKQELSINTDKGAQVIAMPQIKLQEAPKQQASQVSLPPLPGNRPVDAGNLQVVGTISAMGERPIFASNFEVTDTITVSGNRPIASSNLQISETAMIMKNRPIATNNLDGDRDLMGYLD